MNNLFKKIATAFVGMAMAVGVGVAFGRGSNVRTAKADSTITINWSSFGISSTLGEKNETESGCGVNISSVSNNGVAKNGTINNTIAVPGSISNLTVNGAATGSTKTDGTFEVFAGTTVGTTTNSMGEVTGLSSTAANKSIDFTGNYTFFKIVVGSARTLKFTSIVVTYSESATTKPTVTEKILGPADFEMEVGGQDVDIASDISLESGNPLSDYIVSSANTSVVTVSGTTLHAVGLGTASISISKENVETETNITKYTSASFVVTAVHDPIYNVEGNEFVFANLYLANDTKYESDFVGTDFKVSFSGGNSGKYFNTGTGIRVYKNGGTISLAALNNKVLTEVQFTFADGYAPASEKYTVSAGEYNVSTGVWTGEAASFTLVYSADSGDPWRLQSVSATASVPAPAMHTITFAGGQGATGSMDPAEVEHGQEYTLPANGFEAPSGKQFAGWQVSTDLTKVYQPQEKITVNENVTITASWEDIPVVKHSVTYSVGQETYVVNDIVEGENHTVLSFEATQLELPQGKEFTGWKQDDQGELIAAGSSLKVDADIVLVAQFEDAQVAPVIHTVSFLGGQGAQGSMNPVEVEHGNKYVLPANGFQAPEGKEFEGWLVSTDATKVYQPQEEITVNENVTVTASWEDVVPPAPTMFSVTFNANGGEGNMAAQEIEENHKYELPANGFEAPEGKEFEGWLVGDSQTPVDPGTEITVTANVVITASWKDATPVQPAVVNSPVEFVPTDFTTAQAEQSATHEQVTIHMTRGTQNTTNNDFRIYANETMTVSCASGYEIYKIEFNAEGVESGKTPANLSASTGTYAYANDLGTWSGRAASIEFSGTAQSRIKWAKVYFVVEGGEIPTPATPTQYTIHFVGGTGAGGTMNDVKVDEGTQYAAPACSFTAPEGKEFDKWVDATGADITFPLTINADVTLYAAWKDSATPVDPGTDPTPVDPTPTTNEPIVLDGTALEFPVEKTLHDKTTTYGGVTYVAQSKDKSTSDLAYLRSYTNGNGDNRFSDNPMIMMGKQGAFLYNSTALPAGISKIEIVNNNSFQEGNDTRTPSLNVMVEVQFGKSAMTTALTGEGTQLDTVDKIFTYTPSEAGDTFFRLQIMSGHNAQFQMKIYFGDPATTPVDPGTDPTPVDPGTDPTPVDPGTSINYGTAAAPLTIAHANAMLEGLNLADGDFTAEKVYIKGTVKSHNAYNEQYGSYSKNFVIQDGDNEFLAYHMYIAEGVLELNDALKAENGLVGYEVTLCGYVKNYKGTIEMAQFGSGDTAVNPTIIAATAPTTPVDPGTNPVDPGTTPVDPGTQPGTDPVDPGTNPTPAKTVTGIQVSGFDKVNYQVGQELDLSELKVLIFYSDGTFDVATADQIKVTGYDASKAGQQTVTVSVGDQSWTVKVMVTDAMGCHGSIVAGSALISLTTLLGAGLLMLKKRKED